MTIITIIDGTTSPKQKVSILTAIRMRLSLDVDVTHSTALVLLDPNKIRSLVLYISDPTFGFCFQIVCLSADAFRAP
jgi:hypothetical protein